MIHPSRFQSTTMISITIHVGVIALLLVVSKTIIPPAAKLIPQTTVASLISPYMQRPIAPAMGGGGGAHQDSPATAGRPPKFAPRQLVPPMLETNPHPKLTMEMTIEAPPETVLPDHLPSNIGDPLGKLLNNSAGRGGPLGIGEGERGTGIGNKSGAHMGSGDGDIGPLYIGGRGGVTNPVVIRQVSPEFSDDARRAKQTGMVVLRTDIDTAGRPRNIRVTQHLGMGLDEEAIHALEQWLFKPGTKDGKPVAVSISVEVRFQLF
ncbi:MAG: TonB family protein [Terriglobia bacterium]